MDRIRSWFNQVTMSERYSRFMLQPVEDGENHVEVKLSDDATEVEDNDGGSPRFRPAPLRQGRRNLCYLVLGSLLIFFTGCLIGYVSHRTSDVAPDNCSAAAAAATGANAVATGAAAASSDVKPTSRLDVVPTFPSAPPEVQLAWKDITQLLKQKLTSEAFDKTLSDFDLRSRSAGSQEDVHLANRLIEEFKKLDMSPWSDNHYVQLQKPDRERPNRVTFGTSVFEPTGYLAYSAQGKVRGKLVYGNYGRKEDLDVLKSNNVEVGGNVLLLRAGKISFAEQVDNAAKKGASAVLIFPDSDDYKYDMSTPLYGQVHLGSGDPYTPGFPSFNHTQFPPTKSSGLPEIPAQTITANMARTLLGGIGGPEPDASSGFTGGLKSLTYRLGGVENVTVEVNNVLVNTEVHNVFGVIQGFIDPDRYVVLGAQRDAWGQGYAKATIGTAVLLELAKAVRKMVEEDGFRPRRSLIFASWSAGEYGSVGATEWLEGYMSSIDRNVVTYISLDGLVMGLGGVMASASPLLYSLLESTMKETQNPFGSGSVYDLMGRAKWESNTLRPMSIDDPSYPFLTFSGIPSISFHFITPNTEAYTYYGTDLDSKDHLDYKTNHRTNEMTALAAQFAGSMALRLVHDRLLRLDVRRYSIELSRGVGQVYQHVRQHIQAGRLKGVDPNWLFRARGAFQRAAANLNNDKDNTDLEDVEACRVLNNRMMRVEHTLLSPYVTPTETPFRHVLHGRGPHTMASIAASDDMEQLHIQLALVTWTLQGCANAMVGEIWEITGM
ncbi:transferrin receptor 1b [Antennarius striatus]|uniref:transferrin receptor 1b n=1 Tax=Antennarius striatus TaxID=241820 RepID=UPI0035B2FF73